MINNPLEDRIKNLETEIKKINTRNERVEKDKKWETSPERKILIAILTYISISLFMFYTQVSNPLINAVIPTTAFLISTLTLSFFKSVWLKKDRS